MTYYTAIIFFAKVADVQRWPQSYDAQQTKAAGRDPAKYRNINNPANFEAWALRQGAIYINYYFKKDKSFSHREYLVQFNQTNNT